jgi:glycosyltransferase involved in cell wall biosynthesis
MSITVSVIICSHNRADLLCGAIRSLMNQTVSDEAFEIIVVDNASTDGTKEMVRRESRQLMNLIYVHEPRLGVSKARNRGWSMARGSYVAWLDDDAKACPGWVEAVIRRFDSDKEGLIGELGGKISPIWGAPPPDWISDSMRRSLTILSWSETPRFLEKNEWLAAANIAYRKSTIQACGGFNESLGRIGNTLLSGAENDLGNRIRASGMKSYYDPGMAVEHYIHPERLRQDWFYERSFGQGLSEVIGLRTSEDFSEDDRLTLLAERYGNTMDPQALIMDLLATAEETDTVQKKINRFKQLGEIVGFLKKEIGG